MCAHLNMVNQAFHFSSLPGFALVRGFQGLFILSHRALASWHRPVTLGHWPHCNGPLHLGTGLVAPAHSLHPFRFPCEETSTSHYNAKAPLGGTLQYSLHFRNSSPAKALAYQGLCVCVYTPEHGE